MDGHTLTLPHGIDTHPAAGAGWRWYRVFGATWVAYTSCQIVHLLLLKLVQPLAPPSVPVRLGMAVVDGAMIGLCTLVLAAVGERTPVERPYRARHIGINALSALAASIVTLTTLYEIGRVVDPGTVQEGLVAFNVVSISHTLFAYLVIAAVVQAASYQRRYRTREVDALRLQSQLTAAQLESLRAKLHPHFLFNTLNGISDLIFTNPGAADALVLRLARLLRATLDTVDREISVREELEMLTAYFDIQRVRFGERLRVTIDTERAAADARVPPFLMQPLAENAIQHGVAPRATGGVVSVRALVRADERGDRLVLELSDDGVGLPEAPNDGVGLRITRERLRALYQGAGALTVASRPGGGTVARIELPYAVASR